MSFNLNNNQKTLAGILITVGVVLVALWLFFAGTATPAQADELVQQATTSETSTPNVTVAPTSSIENISKDEVKEGTTCVAKLPDNPDIIDRVKSTFKELGCELEVMVNSDTGNAEANATTTDIPETPAQDKSVTETTSSDVTK